MKMLQYRPVGWRLLQRASSPIERALFEQHLRWQRTTITEGLTREFLLEWERRLVEKERDLDRERWKVQQNFRG